MPDDIAALNGGQPVRTDEENTGGRDFEPMPAGWYPVECKKAEIKTTKDGQGKYLWLECDVIGDRYAGRKLFPRFNLVNKSSTAVEIGQRDLGFLGQSVGMPTGVKASESLIGKQFDVRLKIKPATGDYPADNDATAYEILGKMSSKAPGQAPGPKANGTTAKAGQARAWDKPPAAVEKNPDPPAPAPAASAPTPAPATAAVAPAPVASGASKRPWERK